MHKHGGIGLAIHKRVIDYAEGLLLADLEGIPVPEPTCAPVDGLALFDGYECEDYGYACPSEDNMTLHHKTKHGWHKADGPRW